MYFVSRAAEQSDTNIYACDCAPKCSNRDDDQRTVNMTCGNKVISYICGVLKSFTYDEDQTS